MTMGGLLREDGGDTRYNPLPSRVTVPLYPVPRPSRTFYQALTMHRGDQADHAARTALADVLGVPAQDVRLTASGTQALMLALRQVRRDATDEVIIPAFACPSLIAAVLQADMVPVLCDLGTDWAMDIDQVAPLLSPQTRAVVAAHIFGTAAALERLQELCDVERIHLIDDAAQALGGSVRDRPLGTWGTFGVLSFGRHKPVFAAGGGALVRGRSTADFRWPVGAGLPGGAGGSGLVGLGRAVAVDVLRRFGSRLPIRFGLQSEPVNDARGPLEQYSISGGVTGGLTPVSAAMLLDQLPRLDEYRSRVRSYAQLYAAALGPALGTPPAAVLSGELNFYPVRCAPLQRHEIAARFARAGVETTWLYFPLHRIGQYSGRFRARNLSFSDRLWQEVLCVPCRGWHKPSQANRVAEVLSGVTHALPRQGEEISC